MRRLRQWANEHKYRTKIKMEQARLDLQDCQEMIDHEEFSENDWKQFKLKQKIVLKVVLDEESEPHQKSRLKWIKSGDQNTSFFHKTIIQKRNRNSINSLITDEGMKVQGEKNVGQVCTNFYNKLFTWDNSPYPRLNTIRLYVKPYPNPETLNQLITPISAVEIKSTLFSIHPNRALGPDGFNGFFFQHNWHILGNDVIKAILESFENRSLLKQLNSTTLTLIPKTQNPTMLKDFRPISCVSTVYKIIAKILANRLKLILPSIIAENQSAFVEGRGISDSIFLAQKLLNGYHLKNSPPRIAIKVDIMKAYDTVRWVFFLWDVLQAMGIPPVFIRWVSFSISLNGGLYGHFRSSRGIRQSDPLSPYLFVLGMNVLSGILAKKTVN